MDWQSDCGHFVSGSLEAVLALNCDSKVNEPGNVSKLLQPLGLASAGHHHVHFVFEVDGELDAVFGHIEHLDSDASVWVMEGTRDDGLSVIMLSFVILWNRVYKAPVLKR